MARHQCMVLTSGMTRQELLEARGTLLAERRYSEARALELAYLSSNPDDHDLQYRAAWTAAALNDYSAAVSHCLVAAKEKANSKYALALSRYLRATGESERADAAEQEANRHLAEERAAFERRRAALRTNSDQIVRHVLSAVVPNWRYANHSISPEPLLLDSLRSFDTDEDPEWMRFANSPVKAGTIVDFGALGRFAVGDPKQVLHKRLSRGIPWELPIAALMMELSARCSPDAVIIDVGANVGSLTIPIARHFAGRVLAFEPVQETYQALCTNLALNDISNVDARRAACSSHSGYGAMFDVSDQNPGIAKLLETPTGDTLVTTIDDEVSAPVALIKMDIEGHEVEALRGASRTLTEDKPLVICEVLPSNTKKTIELFSSFSYAGSRLFRSDWIFHPHS